VSEASSPSFPHVFEPVRLRHKTLRSRITFGAHTANMADGGLPGARHVAYNRERALGVSGKIDV
jgi:2,4-dienoyl-CoA reductase-like NADH-dependent reductase (Old Yellow Enzyme family)